MMNFLIHPLAHLIIKPIPCEQPKLPRQSLGLANYLASITQSADEEWNSNEKHHSILDPPHKRFMIALVI